MGSVPPLTVNSLTHGDHVCCIYETEDEHRALLTAYLRQGLERNEKVLYIVDQHSVDTLLGYLRDEGIDPGPYLGSGQLRFPTANQSYTEGRSFDPDAMIATLHEETATALAEGYRGLRMTGEMSWALQGLPESEGLVEYENKLNEFCPGNSCSAVCKYSRARFSPDLLISVVDTHPIVFLGDEAYDNHFFVTPQQMLQDRASTTLENRFESLRKNRTLEMLREQFLLGAAHDMRTPLSTLRGALELLSQDLSEERFSDLREMMVRQSSRLSDLIGAVVEFSRIHQGRVELGPVSVREVVDRSVDDLPPPPRVSVDRQVSERKVQANPKYLHRALVNLLENGYKYGARKIRVRDEARDGRLALVVADDGPGVEHELVPVLFEPFSRGRSGEGSGLGLAIVRSMIEACDGTVRYEPASPEGAVFVLELPLAA